MRDAMEKYQRVCAFGWWAGVVGVYYTLRGYGLKTKSYNLPNCQFLKQIIYYHILINHNKFYESFTLYENNRHSFDYCCFFSEMSSMDWK